MSCAVEKAVLWLTILAAMGKAGAISLLPLPTDASSRFDWPSSGDVDGLALTKNRSTFKDHSGPARAFICSSHRSRRGQKYCRSFRPAHSAPAPWLPETLGFLELFSSNASASPLRAFGEVELARWSVRGGGLFFFFFLGPASSASNSHLSSGFCRDSALCVSDVDRGRADQRGRFR